MVPLPPVQHAKVLVLGVFLNLVSGCSVQDGSEQKFFGEPFE